MPYIPGFTNDIFISFSHHDDSEGWVRSFHDQLLKRLRQIAGANLTIWRDSKLGGMDVLDDQIFTQLEHSALLIAIISPSSMESYWCADERRAFEHFAALNGGLRIDSQLREIKVVKTPLPDDRHRDLFGVRGFEFYERDGQSGRFSEFNQSDPRFAKICDTLAQEISRMLNDFSRYLKDTHRKETVYVATTSPDLERSREAIAQQLKDWEYAVAPEDTNPPHRFETFQAIAKAELDASILSVHVASNQSHPLTTGGQDTIIKQYEQAKSLRKERIVWVPPNRELFSEFEDVLESDLQNGVELLKYRPIESLKDVIEEKLTTRRQQQQTEHARRSAGQRELYFISDSHKDPQALKVIEYLDNNGLMVVPSPFSNFTWDELQELHVAQLQLSNAVLLYWGMGSEKWFLAVRRIIVTEQMRRKKTSTAEPLTQAFYFSSPRMEKSQYRRLADDFVEQYDGFEPDEMNRLLKLLR